MEIKKLVEYQKVDAKLFELQKNLNKSPNKEKCAQLSSAAKDSQQKSIKLEEQASTVSAELSQLVKQADQIKKRIKSFISKDVEKMSGEDLDVNITQKDALSQELSAIDKKATKLAETVNSILTEFNKTIQIYNMAKSKYVQAKAAYDKEIAEISPKMQALETELKAIEKNIDPSSIEEYKKRRSDKTFPVLVPLSGRACGGCHMEMPISSIAKLEEKGYLVCENCRRIIYNLK